MVFIKYKAVHLLLTVPANLRQAYPCRTRDDVAACWICSTWTFSASSWSEEESWSLFQYKDSNVSSEFLLVWKAKRRCLLCWHETDSPLAAPRRHHSTVITYRFEGVSQLAGFILILN